MQVGDRVLVLVDEIPGTGVSGDFPAVPVPDQTYGEVIAMAETELGVEVLLEGEEDPWYFNAYDLEVVRCAQ